MQASVLSAMLLPVSAGAVLASHLVAWFSWQYAVTAVLVYIAASVWACGDTMQRERMGALNTAALVYWLAILRM